MGWSYLHKEKGVGTIECLTREIECDNDQGTWKVLGAALVREVAYFAIERVKKPCGTRKVFGCVFLINRSRGRKANEQWNFGWKDVHEEMEPFNAECPTAILELLSPTEHPSALAWRARCVERATWIREQKARLQALKDGQTIRLGRSARWQRRNGDAVTAQILQVVDLKKRWFRIAEPGCHPWVVSLSRQTLLDTAFTVLTDPSDLESAEPEKPAPATRDTLGVAA